MAILQILAHPYLEKSRANRLMLGVTAQLPGVRRHDLYDCYPDFFIDVGVEQGLLQNHRLVVLQFPFYWYSVPPLLKEWFDAVLTFGFAYGPGGTALQGKILLPIVTTGGGAGAYERGGHNRFTMAELLRPLEQTAALCGMHYCRPFVVHDALKLNDQELENAGHSVSLLLKSYQKNPELFLENHRFSSLE